MVKFNFKGLMCPVFTAFTNDRKQVNCDIIDKYCHFLKQKGIQGVLVNGTTGEGTCLRVDERKRLAEEWVKVCGKNQVICMVQIGGCCIADVCELAEHAEKIGVDCVLVLPDLFFKPRTEEDLVNYLKDIAKCCPTRPLYYYHIPKMTNVWLSMPRFYDLCERTITTFCGIKYTHGDLEVGCDLLKEGRNILLGADTILCGALALGFDAAILTTLNICPELVSEVYDQMMNHKWREGQAAQLKMNRRIKDITTRGNGDWVECMKQEFNKINTTIGCGPHRKPIITWNKN